MWFKKKTDNRNIEIQEKNKNTEILLTHDSKVFLKLQIREKKQCRVQFEFNLKGHFKRWQILLYDIFLILIEKNVDFIADKLCSRIFV